MATTEPLKVIAPTNTDTTIEMPATKAPVPSPSLPASGSRATPRATNREDIPPQPLNRATVSGMAVIGTFCEVMVPRTPPTRVPPMIQSQALESMPLVLRKLINTPNTAKAKATAAI